MSAIGSARARGPEMWSDISVSPPPRRDRAGSVGCLVEQGPQGRVLQRLGGVRVIQHLLAGRVHALRLPDLFHGAAVVPRVRTRRPLGTEDEGLQRGPVREPRVALG